MSSKKKCEHGRYRSQCKECGGGSMCEHGRRRSACKECGGSQIYEHSKVRSKCKECGGSEICEHGRHRRFCQQCGGSGLCEHRRQRPHCKECGGSGLCEHNRLRFRCSRCKPDGAYKMYIRNARNRQIPFELSLEDFKWLVSYPCSSCGESSKPMGVDRVDNTKSYRFDNVQPLCDMCNRMKSDHSEEEFDQQIIKIIQHRPELVQRAGFSIQQIAA